MTNENLKNEMLSQLVKITRISENLKLSLESDTQFVNQEGYRKTLLNMKQIILQVVCLCQRTNSGVFQAALVKNFL